MTETTEPKQRFPYKTEPFADYQRDFLRRSWSLPAAFLAMEQGTGKTWVAINTAAALYLHKKIDGMVVLAPNGVHTAWALEQLPQHMPDVVPWRAHVWSSGKERVLSRKRLSAREWDVMALATDRTIFPILCVNSEAVTIALAAKAIGTMLTQRRCLFVVDESGDFTKPGGKRTRRLMRWRARAPFRRCLDGTPVGVSPFELYAPYRFLSPTILGYDTFQEMKDAHAEWDEFERSDNGRSFKVVAVRNGKKQWKNLDYLHDRIAPYTFRITKEQALPFLPRKQYATRFFELSEQQWQLTMELWNNNIAQLEDGTFVSAEIKIKLYLRCQQICAGYVPPDIVFGEDTEPIAIIPGPNPRLDMALDELKRHRGVPTIVWTRFHFDIDILSPALTQLGIRHVTYDGRMSTEAKDAAKAAFLAREVDVFVANAASGGRGLNLQVAERELFYNHYWGLRKRAQAEDRAHRIGMAQSLLITDLVARQSIDMLIRRAYRQNVAVASLITGDPARDWSE